MQMNWKPIKVKLRDLRPWERNPRRISRRRADRLIRSWREFGQAQTIAVGPNLEVYDGHQRLSVLRAAYGDDYEVLALQCDEPLNDDQRARLTLLLHAGATGVWDWEALRALGEQNVVAGGLDLESLNEMRHDIEALNEMLLQSEPKVQDAAWHGRAEDLRVKWRVEPGQTWRLGRHTAICADAATLDIPRADLVVTDPPYDMPTRRVADIIARYATRAVVFAAGTQIVELCQCTRVGIVMVWLHETRKVPTINMPLMMHTLVCVCYLGDERDKWKKPRPDYPSVFKSEYQTDDHGHGKPADVFAWAMEGFAHERSVVDPFMGSGAALLACEATGRVCTGIEMDPATFASALERFHRSTGITPQLIP